MADVLEGTVKTPLGTVSKKSAAIAVGFLAVLAGVVWYRHKNAKPDPSLAGAPEINPATGYPYGSEEDAAALAAQARYQFPSGGSGGSDNSSGTTFSNNGEWSRYVINYMSDNDLVSEVSSLGAALGKYLDGQALNADQVSLVQQAIAIAGKPPISGSTGYPPSINTSNVVVEPPPTGGGEDTPRSTADVKAGWKVDQFILDYARQFQPGFTWEVLSGLNPEVSQNIKWNKDHRLNTFIHSATYRVK